LLLLLLLLLLLFCLVLYFLFQCLFNGFRAISHSHSQA
jgi:hypothetical protein